METESTEECKPGNDPDTSTVAAARAQGAEEKTTANMAWIDFVAMLEELEYK